MPSGNGRLLIAPNKNQTEFLPGILGGGSGVTIRVRVNNYTSGGFKGPFDGTIKFVNQNGDWENRKFYSSGSRASVQVNTHGKSAFQPSFTIYNPNIMGLRLHFEWKIWGSPTKPREQKEIKNENSTYPFVDNENSDTKEQSDATTTVIKATSDTTDDLLLKKPEDLTESEIKDLMVQRHNSQNNKALFDELVEKERQWFSTRYGDEPVKFDETGKMIQPVAINPAPKEPKPLTVPGGQTMADAIKVVAAQLDQTSDNKVDVIRGLQTGINRTNEKTEMPLKVDGLFGPKSATGLKKAIATLGPTKMTESNALGQFQYKTDKAKKSADTNNLIKDATASIEPLPPQLKEQKKNTVGLALQTALNETNKDDDQIPQLKEDGIIGPVTEGVFDTTVRKKETEDLTDNFGYFLGFS